MLTDISKRAFFCCVAMALKDARKNAGLSQGDIAQKVQLTQSMVSKLEHGHRTTLITFVRWAEACSVSPSYLLRKVERGIELLLEGG